MYTDLTSQSHELKDKMYVYDKPEKELARAYVPLQKIDKIYSPDESLCAGTIFPELNRPYEKGHQPLQTIR